jgi:hypothetical protein
MRSRADLAIGLLDHARQVFDGSMRGVTIDDALDAAGGYRSVLGILKHAAAWGHVYHSYAFEPSPRHWTGVDWPRGMRDTIDPSAEYLDEVRAWGHESFARWRRSLAGLDDATFDEQRPCHWGATLPLFDIVVIIANHWSYHAGEVNEALAIRHGHAWEYTEEVEENHISTAGRRLRPEWMSDEQAARYEAYIAARDRQLHGGG